MADVLDDHGNPIVGGLAYAASQKAPAGILAAFDASVARAEELNRCASLYDQVLAGTLADNALAAVLESDASFASYYANRVAAARDAED